MKEKARSRPWTKSFPSAGRRQQLNFLMLCGNFLCMAAWYLPKSRGISTRDVLCFGEGRKPFSASCGAAARCGARAQFGLQVSGLDA